MTSRLATLTVTTAVLLLAEGVQADVVGPPDHISCPTGSDQASCHGSQYCSPLECVDDQDCESNERCEERPVCISERACGGWGASVAEFHGNCAEDGTCSNGSCENTRICMPIEVFGNAGCQCRSVAERPNAAGALLFPALVMALLFLRRRFTRSE